jgi:hypothetical protein
MFVFILALGFGRGAFPPRSFANSSSCDSEELAELDIVKSFLFSAEGNSALPYAGMVRGPGKIHAAANRLAGEQSRPLFCRLASPFEMVPTHCVLHE